MSSELTIIRRKSQNIKYIHTYCMSQSTITFEFSTQTDNWDLDESFSPPLFPPSIPSFFSYHTSSKLYPLCNKILCSHKSRNITFTIIIWREFFMALGIDIKTAVFRFYSHLYILVPIKKKCKLSKITPSQNEQY